MLKSILRLQNIGRTTIRLDRYLRSGSGRKGANEEEESDVFQQIKLKRDPTAATSLIDELDLDLNLDEKSRLINEELVENKFSDLEPVGDQRFAESDLKLNKKQQQHVQSNRLENIVVCKDPEGLFQLIRPRLFRLNATDIRLVYEKLNEFLQVPEDFETQDWVRRVIHQSPVYRALQDYSDSLLAELDTGCLFAMLQTFNLMEVSPDHSLLKRTMNQLNARLNTRSNDFELRDLVNCLATLLACLKKPFKVENGDQRRLIEKLFPAAKLRAMSAGLFEREEPETLIKCFLLVLNSPYDSNRLATEHLISLLADNGTALNYRQTLELLSGIEKSYRMCEQEGLEASRLETMPELIEKCNYKIYRKFVNFSSESSVNFYLVHVHDWFTSTEFSRLVPEFFDETKCRLQATVASFLHLNFASFERARRNASRFVANNAQFNILDERLTKLVYERFQEDPDYRPNINLGRFYSALSRFRLPFIDHQSLTSKFLFCLMNQSRQPVSLQPSTQLHDYPSLLGDLVLNDSRNESLFSYLIGKLGEPNEQLLKRVDYEEVDKLRLASVYLSMFGQLDDQLKAKVKAKLDQLVDGILSASSERTTIEDEIEFEMDSNIQRNGRLSNGIRVEFFGVFDASGSSVPFDRYQRHTSELDQIPAKLKPNQKL